MLCVMLCVCLCVRRISLGGEGNALYPVLSSYICNTLDILGISDLSAENESETIFSAFSTVDTVI